MNSASPGNGGQSQPCAERQLEAGFDGALDRGEFLLFYQPIVALSSHRIVGFEALLRWQHPTFGMVQPLEFVPVAERTEFIVPLGHWVLREACTQLREWQNATPAAEALWVSVNLSIVQFRQPSLVDEVSAVLRDTGLEPRSLVLELTEGMAMEDPRTAHAVLSKLRALGVRVSVDDFGTGHSALSYLRQLPLDSLKIDRSFVSGIEASQDMASIVGAVSTMTRQLGLQMVAEGIENSEQLALIRSLDCEFGQGFLFSAPVGRDGAAALIAGGLPELPACATAATLASRVWRRRWASGAAAAAAVLIVLFSVGLPRMRGDGAALPASPRSSRLTDVRLPESGGSPPDAPPVTAARTEAAMPSAQPEPVALSASPPSPPASPASASLDGLLTSLRLVHQHRLGNCRGLLIVSRDGVAFVPDDERDQATHGFNLLYDEFLHMTEGDSLTIRTTARVYRFREPDDVGQDAAGLETLAQSITAIRTSGLGAR
jgi:EAL domain-containing protein (putative c-di-GMP-specific phosphodiesterase class I)